MWFGRKKPSHIVVSDFVEACGLLRGMGVDVRQRKEAEHAGRAVLIHKDGLEWAFAGDTEVFTVARWFHAPERWTDRDLSAFNLRKNFATAIHHPEENAFILLTHIVIEGGVVIQNLARIVHNFDATIESFSQALGLSPSHLRPLE